MKKILKVYAAGEALVPDLNALKSGLRRFVGRKYNANIGEAGGFEPLDNPVEIEYHFDYIQALKDGDLIAANQETADLAGLKFNK